MKLPVVTLPFVAVAVVVAFLVGLVCANWLSSLLALAILTGLVYRRGFSSPPSR